MLKKIVILGPESTGKSTLCDQLASYYNTEWCPEYAREYLRANGKDYSFDDLLSIAKGQLALEDKFAMLLEKEKLASQTNLVGGKKSTIPNLLFLDTNQYVMKVWCEYVFNHCHTWILDRIVDRKYDLYLLCNVDLPWVIDELREYPDEQPRRELFHIYKDLMQNQLVPWVEISGNDEDRLQKAIIAIDNLLLSW